MVRRAALLSSAATVVALAAVWSGLPTATSQPGSMMGTFTFAEFATSEVKGLVAVTQQRERRVVRVVGAFQGLERSEYRLVLSPRSCARQRPGSPILSTRILASPEYFVVGSRRSGPLSSVKSARVIEFQNADDPLLICTRTQFTQDDSLPPPPPDI